MGSSISSISFAAASRRPRRSCQRSSTRSDQDRPTPPPASPLGGVGWLAVCRWYESTWTWSGHAAGVAVPAQSGPARSTRPWWSAAARGGGILGRWAARANRISERPQAGGPTQGRSRLRYQVPMQIASRP
jgi:hypothetical protein